MAEYQLTATDAFVIRTADQAIIPNDDGNHDWQVYQQWLADGGVPDPYVPPPEPDPRSIPPTMIAAASAKISGGVITLQGTPFNIASATRQSTGVYHFAFTERVPNTNYTAMITCAQALSELASQATDGFIINTTKASNDNPFDAKAIDFQIYGQVAPA